MPNNETRRLNDESTPTIACEASTDCGQAVVGRGLCRKHYLQAWRAGTIHDRPTRKRDLLECPEDHAHDLETCWQEHGCRCSRCQHLRKMDRQRQRTRLIAYGRTESFRPERVLASTVRDHLDRLMAHAGLARIADAAHISRSEILDVYYGQRGTNHQHVDASLRTITASTANRLLAVTPNQLVHAFVDATGTIRRLRALVAVGYSQKDLAAHLGMHVGNFSTLIRQGRPRVSAKTFSATCILFRELWSHPVNGKPGDRSRAIARSQGWVGPLAWDDIDDPDEVSNITGNTSNLIDEIAVELALTGAVVKLNKAERTEAITRLHSKRWSDNRIADTLHITDRTVIRYRQELKLVAFGHAEIKPVSA